MRLQKLWLKQFRNLSETVFEFKSGYSVFLVGENNQGKTNFLESVYTLGHGVSVKEKSTENIVQFNTPEALLGGDFYDDNSQEKQRVYLKLSSDGKRYIFIDGVVQKKLSTLIDIANIEFLSADVLHIFQESAGFRRGVLDKFATKMFPEYGGLLKQYERVLSQRNRLLKTKKRTPELVIFNQQLIEFGSKIMRLRISLLNQLEEKLSVWISSLILDSVKLCQCVYQINKVNSVYSQLGYEEWLSDQFKQNEDKEYELGFTTAGIHRDDFDIQLNDKSLYTFYSRGINRSVAILLYCAQLLLVESNKNRKPILCLDDTFAEIDRDKKRALIQFLEKNAQLFYCSVIESDKDLFNCCEMYKISNGRINKCLT